jgi:hypothetical protein
MRQLIILLTEFALIIALVVGIYYFNLSKTVNYPYKYQKPIIATHLDLTDQQLREELTFFLAKELGLYEGEFQILDVVFLYTQELSGADYILVTLRAPNGSLCQITVSRNFLPWARWVLNPKNFSVIEPIKPLIDYAIKVPKGMQDLGVTPEQLGRYYKKHPEVTLKGETAFLDAETGKYNLPSDWYQTVFNLMVEKDKTMRLVPDKGERLKAGMVNSYWKADYPTEYLGLGYREYLYVNFTYLYIF